MSEGKRKRPVTKDEVRLIALHWEAGFTEEYIAATFDRQRYVIRRLMENLGYPPLRVMQHKRAKEWLNAQISDRERGACEARGQEDTR